MSQAPSDLPWPDALLAAAAELYQAGATAVWLFGSRAGGAATDRLSDVDLAVEGLADGDAAVRASRRLRGRVDIIRMEAAPPALRYGILRRRRLVPRVALDPGTARPRPPLPDSLAGLRTRAVAEAIREIRPRSVIDLGCGAGWLLGELAADEGLERLTGVDFNAASLAVAKQRIGAALGPRPAKRVDLRHGLITCRDPLFPDHDAAAAIEVIEHFEPPQLRAFADTLFGHMRPLRAALTTPNVEYNAVWSRHRAPRRRHPDHRFEWSRAQFSEWAEGVARSYGYRIDMRPVGTVHPDRGSPTQLAVFDLDG
jgi:SAM-dependent methyltransferase